MQDRKNGSLIIKLGVTAMIFIAGIFLSINLSLDKRELPTPHNGRLGVDVPLIVCWI